MPKIVEEKSYDGAQEKVKRLGLSPVLDEIRKALTGFSLQVLEKKDSNGGAAVRELIDQQFKSKRDWVKKQTGDVDWTFSRVIDGTRVSVGVEIQVSARSDLIVVDLIHLRKAIVSGLIDVGVLVVPSDRLAVFLTDRAPFMSAAIRHVSEARVEDLPLILIAFEHDGPGPALAKKRKAS